MSHSLKVSPKGSKIKIPVKFKLIFFYLIYFYGNLTLFLEIVNVLKKLGTRHVTNKSGLICILGPTRPKIVSEYDQGIPQS